MVRYAQKECHDCFGIFPGNVMRWKTVSYVAGTSVRPWNREEFAEHQRTTTHYQNKSLLLCPECYKKRSLGLFFVLAMGAMLAGGLLVVALLAPIASNVEQPARSPVLEEEAYEFAAEVAPNEDGPEQVVEAEGNDLTADMADSVSEEADLPNEPDPAEFSFDTSEIRSATIVALENGQSTLWKSQGASGYVVVSSERTAGQNVCRNVYFSIILDTGQSQSPTKQMCKPSTGEWTESL